MSKGQDGFAVIHFIQLDADGGVVFCEDIRKMLALKQKPIEWLLTDSHSLYSHTDLLSVILGVIGINMSAARYGNIERKLGKLTGMAFFLISNDNPYNLSEEDFPPGRLHTLRLYPDGHICSHLEEDSD